ncbi:uncharacterized protein G2W53_002252 [Senna tora]|uniref:Uncharacterized protein n=1 Tax=Senna tora TaxID=362788 RepID=A0A834XKA8_9FABA|nr:uncharacterized protein G2W53_002252 [Senna tora]
MASTTSRWFNEHEPKSSTQSHS